MREKTTDICCGFLRGGYRLYLTKVYSLGGSIPILKRGTYLFRQERGGLVNRRSHGERERHKGGTDDGITI